MFVLFLLLACLAVILVGVFIDAHRMQKVLLASAKAGAKNAPTKLPRAVSALIVAAQISELGTLVWHANATNIIATVLLFTMLLAISSGTAESLE